MRILVIGSGAREHAVLWRLWQDGGHELFVCPGNAGMDSVALRLSVADRYSIDEFMQLALANAIDLTIVGPENYLVEGIVDRFQAAGLRIFGPTAAAAKLEGSKLWAKEIMQRVGIPTASWRAFRSVDDARERASELAWQCVLKADGLAAGKGSFVCESQTEVEAALAELAKLRESSSTVLVEERLRGEEVSVFAISDGQTVVPFGAAQDHKRLLDGDRGPNTGGMGAYSPVNHMLVAQGFADSFFQPLVTSLRALEIPYVGVLYAGAIVTEEGPKILEFNCRFGDPEAEVLLRRLESDFATLLFAATDGQLHTVPQPLWSSQEALCVVMASRGYPWQDDFASAITGVQEAEAVPGVIVFHAGTQADPATSEISTQGGRVLCITAVGDDLGGARDRAYEAVARIEFEGAQYRTDIGSSALSAAWQTRWRKSPRWELQMRAVTSGLDSVAEAVRRLQTHVTTANVIEAELYGIRQRLFALKLQTMLPGQNISGVPRALNAELFRRYLSDQLARDQSVQSAAYDVFKRTESLTAGMYGAHKTRDVESFVITLNESTLKFEQHRDYRLFSWPSNLDASAAVKLLDKERDQATAFYVTTDVETFQFEPTDSEPLHLMDVANSSIAAVRLETPSYTCLWSRGDLSSEGDYSRFALLGRTVVSEDLWWFVTVSSEPSVADDIRSFLDRLEMVTQETSGPLEVDA